jgi:hypothetical protein
MRQTSVSVSGRRIHHWSTTGGLELAGGVLAWGLLVPLLTFCMGPYIQAVQPNGQSLSWDLLAGAIYY